MRVLYLFTNSRFDKSVCNSFKELKQDIIEFRFGQEIYKKDFTVLSETERYSLAAALQKRDYDVVFSLSYIHEASVFCNMLGVIYLAWVIEYPDMDLYRNSVSNACNCFFVSDKNEVERLQGTGANNVFYLPAAFGGTLEKGTVLKDPKYDVSFMGQIEDNITEGPFAYNGSLSPESQGYLDGMVQCQRIVYGMDILQKGVPNYVLEELKNKYPLNVPADVTEDFWNIYKTKWMWDQVTNQERKVVLQKNYRDITVFSGQKASEENLYNVEKYPQTAQERKEIIETSKINLYIMNRQAQQSVPWQVFEIMSYGGFLITNYHSGMLELFEPGKEFAYFEDDNDLELKLRIYLSNAERRNEIAKSAYEKIKNEHLIIHRVREILSIL